MIDIFTRSRMLLGEESISELQKAHVIIFGIGGVGGNCIESLVRSGVGEVTIVDNDKITTTNLNRQIIALHSTLGRDKVEVMKERLLEINPEVIVHAVHKYVDKRNIDEFDFKKYDYIIDTIDSTWAKLTIIEKAKSEGIEIISCMGTGNKLDPFKLKIMDISETTYCPLARLIRKQLRKKGIYSLKVLASDEKIMKIIETNEYVEGKSIIAGSVSFVTNTAGLMITSQVVGDIANKQKK